MKPTPQGPRSKPKANYAFLTSDREMFYPAPPYKRAKGTHHVIFDMPSQSAAKALARFWNLGEAQQIEALAETMHNASHGSHDSSWDGLGFSDKAHWRHFSRAVLALLTGNQPKGARK